MDGTIAAILARRRPNVRPRVPDPTMRRFVQSWRAVPRFLAVILLCAVTAVAQETRPLQPPEARALPGSPTACLELARDVEAEIRALDALQAREPTENRALLIQLLIDQAATLKQLERRKAELIAEVNARGRRANDAVEMRRRLDSLSLQERKPDLLPDPLERDSERKIVRDREAADGQLQRARTDREAAAAAVDRARAEADRVQRDVIPAAARALNEATSDLASYETDSREAVKGGLEGEAVRVLHEQVYLNRLKVMAAQHLVDRYETSPSDQSDADVARLRLLVEEQRIKTLETRIRRLDELLDKAYEARLARTRRDRDAWIRLANDGAAWARPYFRERAALAQLQFDSSEMERGRRLWEKRLAESGEIRLLDTEATGESEQFARAETRPNVVDDLVPETTKGLITLIARRQRDLDRVARLQEDARARKAAVREQLRAARAASEDDADRARFESSRAACVVPADVELATDDERDAASEDSWNRLRTDLAAATSAWKKGLDDFLKTLDVAADQLDGIRAIRERNLLRYRSALTWTRDPSAISLDSIRQAYDDAGSIPEATTSTVKDVVLRIVEWTAGRIRGGAWAELIKVFGALLVVIGLIIFVHGNISKTFVWIEGHTLEGAPVSVGLRMVATLLRNTEVTGLIAFAGVAMPWLAGAPTHDRNVAAALFVPPFLWRLGRTLNDICFPAGHETAATGRIPEALSRLLHRTVLWLLRSSAILLPPAILLDAVGYDLKNEGFVDLLYMVHALSCALILLLALMSGTVLNVMIRGKGQTAAAVKAVLVVAYPVLITGVLFLIVLRSLSYKVAAAQFLERFLLTGLWLLGARFVHGFLRRVVLGGRPPVPRPTRDPGVDDEQHDAAGRRHLADRLGRLALKVAAYGPAIYFVLGAWNLTGAGWDAIFERRLPWIGHELTLDDVVTAAVTTVVAFLIIRTTRDLLRFVVLPRTELDTGLRYTIVTLTTYVLVGLAAAVVLGGQLKVNASVITGFVTALGVGLGFGLQEIINNFFSGIILLVERPLKVGDTISVAGASGRVDRINMRSTTIVTAENTGVIIPNKDLISTTVTNVSAVGPSLRSSITVGIAYGSDTGAFRKTVLEVLDGHGLVLEAPAPEIVFTGFGASSLDFEIRFWTRIQTPAYRVKSDLHFALDAAFRRQGIEIPFPMQEIVVRGGSSPPGAPIDAEKQAGE